MFSPALAQASVSPRPLPPMAPTEAMFNLLFRFWPRKSAGTPKASAPAARAVVLMKSRRSRREDGTGSGEVIRNNLSEFMRMSNRIHGQRARRAQQGNPGQLVISAQANGRLLSWQPTSLPSLSAEATLRRRARETRLRPARAAHPRRDKSRRAQSSPRSCAAARPRVRSAPCLL